MVFQENFFFFRTFWKLRILYVYWNLERLKGVLRRKKKTTSIFYFIRWGKVVGEVSFPRNPFSVFLLCFLLYFNEPLPVDESLPFLFCLRIMTFHVSFPSPPGSSPISWLIDRTFHGSFPSITLSQRSSRDFSLTPGPWSRRRNDVCSTSSWFSLLSVKRPDFCFLT